MSYQILIKVPVTAMDDIEARSKLTALTGLLSKNLDLSNTEIKLQEVYTDKPPRGVTQARSSAGRVSP